MCLTLAAAQTSEAGDIAHLHQAEVNRAEAVVVKVDSGSKVPPPERSQDLPPPKAQRRRVRTGCPSRGQRLGCSSCKDCGRHLPFWTCLQQIQSMRHFNTRPINNIEIPSNFKGCFTMHVALSLGGVVAAREPCAVRTSSKSLRYEPGRGDVGVTGLLFCSGSCSAPGLVLTWGMPTAASSPAPGAASNIQSVPPAFPTHISLQAAESIPSSNPFWHSSGLGSACAVLSSKPGRLRSGRVSPALAVNAGVSLLSEPH